MNKEQFAQSFGFNTYEEMLDTTTTVFQENNRDWNVTKIPSDRFLAWDTSQIADDRVEVFVTKEEAEDYLRILRDKSKSSSYQH